MEYKEAKARPRPVAVRYRLIWALALLLYLAALVYLIFYFTERGEGGVNLEFFREIRRFYRALKENVLTITAYQNLLGNVVLFIPFGVIFPFVTNRRFTMPKTALAGFATILAIESTQYLTKSGIFDVDDFLLNGFGVAVGWLIYKLLAAIYRRFFKGPGFYAESDGGTAVSGFPEENIAASAGDGLDRPADWWEAIGSDERFAFRAGGREQDERSVGTADRVRDEGRPDREDHGSADDRADMPSDDGRSESWQLEDSISPELESWQPDREDKRPDEIMTDGRGDDAVCSHVQADPFGEVLSVDWHPDTERADAGVFVGETPDDQAEAAGASTQD